MTKRPLPLAEVYCLMKQHIDKVILHIGIIILLEFCALSQSSAKDQFRDAL